MLILEALTRKVKVIDLVTFMGVIMVISSMKELLL